jgi:hypothetical protein
VEAILCERRMDADEVWGDVMLGRGGGGGVLRALVRCTPQPLWLSLLGALEKCVKGAKGEELADAVLESLKNTLLVMGSLGVLTPAAPDGLWEHTWKAAAAISPTLQAEVLQAPE